MSATLRSRGFWPKLPGYAYLWLAVLIFGAASPITRKLTQLGSQHFVGGHNPISLCNVLFIGNLCALGILLVYHRREWRWQTWQRFSRQEWLNLILVAILAGALAPALIFQALALTGVNNVVLISHLDVPLTLAFSVWWLGEKVNRWQILGAGLAFGGVLLILLLQPATPPVMGFQIGQGELLAAIAAINLAIATLLGKKYLGRVPLGIYNMTRTALGTGVFFVLALILYGQDHFMEAFSPFLWQWMLVYGALIVVCGQSFWLRGLRCSSLSNAALAAASIPVAGMLGAYVILAEVPTLVQVLGGSIILVGIALGQMGLQLPGSAKATGMPLASEVMPPLSMGSGFKGI